MSQIEVEGVHDFYYTSSPTILSITRRRVWTLSLSMAREKLMVVFAFSVIAYFHVRSVPFRT